MPERDSNNTNITDGRKIFVHRHLDMMRELALTTSLYYHQERNVRASKTFNAVAQQAEAARHELFWSMTEPEQKVILNEVRRKYNIGE